MRVELTYGLFRGPWACRPMHTEKKGPGDVDWINQIIRPIFMAWVTEKKFSAGEAQSKLRSIHAPNLQ